MTATKKRVEFASASLAIAIAFLSYRLCRQCARAGCGEWQL